MIYLHQNEIFDVNKYIITSDEHFKRCCNYIYQRINNEGNFNLCTNSPALVKERDKLQKEYLDKVMQKVFIKKNGTKYLVLVLNKKIINYYEDY